MPISNTFGFIENGYVYLVSSLYKGESFFKFLGRLCISYSAFPKLRNTSGVMLTEAMF